MCCFPDSAFHSARSLRWTPPCEDATETVEETATDCNQLHKAATDCNRLQQTATDCNRLHQVATNCNRLQPTATNCKTATECKTATDCNRLQQAASLTAACGLQQTGGATVEHVSVCGESLWRCFGSPTPHALPNQW